MPKGALDGKWAIRSLSPLTKSSLAPTWTNGEFLKAGTVVTISGGKVIRVGASQVATGDQCEKAFFSGKNVRVLEFQNVVKVAPAVEGAGGEATPAISWHFTAGDLATVGHTLSLGFSLLRNPRDAMELMGSASYVRARKGKPYHKWQALIYLKTVE